MNEENVVKQPQNSNKQPTGFQIHPELINKNGRPKKGSTLTDLMKEYLDSENPKTGRPRKEDFIEKVALLAYQGDLTAIKLIWNYLDGMPNQPININKESNADYEAFLRKCEEDGIDPKTGLPLGVNE